MNSSNLEKYKMLLEKGDLDVEIVTDSMTPFIKVGQVIKIGKINDELKPFDLIVFLGAEKRLICHFVIKIFDEHIMTTNSKNISRLDNPILRENILGIVKDVKLSRWFKIKTVLYFLFKNL